MYEPFYYMRSLLYMFILGIIKSWTFGGFGLDKTYILIFFVALSQFLVNFVYFVGMFYPAGSRVLLHVSCLRTIGQLFTEPLFALVMSDFVTRLSILRNERQIATKLQPLNLFLGGIALLRFTSAIPELLQIGGGRSLEEATILIRVEGMTHYQMLQESHSALAYQMVEGVSVAYSLVLVTFIAIWLHNRLLWGVWLVKTGLIIAVAVFGIQSVFIYDAMIFINIVITYMYLNIQSLLYDVEDSREKLDRFFSYNFLFFDDE